MPEFRMNLIRGQVPSPHERRLRYGAMLTYLAVSGAALAMAISVATSWLIRAAGVREEFAQVEQGFFDRHREKEAIEPYAARLEQQMADRIEVLKSVDQQLMSRPSPGRLLYHLALSFPTGITLKSLALDSTDGSVNFEVLVPGSRAEAALGPSDLIAQWKQNVVLSGYVNQIAYVGSQRQSQADRTDVVWRFSGRLVRKES